MKLQGIHGYPKAVHKLFSLCTPPKKLCPKHCPGAIIYGYSYLLFAPQMSDTHYHSHLKPCFTEKIEITRGDFPEFHQSIYLPVSLRLSPLATSLSLWLDPRCPWARSASTSTMATHSLQDGVSATRLLLGGTVSSSLSTSIFTSYYYSHLKKSN